MEPAKGEERVFVRDDGNFVPGDLQKGEHPSLRQRLQTIALLSGGYYVVTHKIFRPIMTLLLSKHPQWKALGKRRGTFNKNAQDEIIYVGMAGVHHVLCAALAQYSRMAKEGSLNGISNRSLYVYAGLTEFAFEWVDFALMAMKMWPYQERDPKFTALLIFHHMFGLLNFQATGTEHSHRSDVKNLTVKLLGVAGIGCLCYPFQQLCDLTTKSGNKKALMINTFNMACHVYVRFYLYFTQARDIFQDVEGHLKRNNQGHLAKYSWAGYHSLSVFNILVFLGGIQKMAQYAKNIQALKK